MEICLGGFDFSQIEISDSSDIVVGVYYCWRFSLRFRKGDIDEIFRIRNGGDAFEVIY